LLLVLRVDRDEGGVDVEIDRAGPVVAAERDQICERTSASPSASSARTAGEIS